MKQQNQRPLGKTEARTRAHTGTHWQAEAATPEAKDIVPTDAHEAPKRAITKVSRSRRKIRTTVFKKTNSVFALTRQQAEAAAAETKEGVPAGAKEVPQL